MTTNTIQAAPAPAILDPGVTPDVEGGVQAMIAATDEAGNSLINWLAANMKKQCAKSNLTLVNLAGAVTHAWSPISYIELAIYRKV